MTLRQLRYLCEVVRCRMNISVAARALGASQPAVSQQLRLLEETLGTPIFLRARNRLTGLTRKGEEIVVAAQGIMADVTGLETAAAAPPRADAPLLRIVSTYAQARYRLPQVIARFKERFPLATVHIVPRSEEGLPELVQDGRADLAIATNPGNPSRALVCLPCEQIQRSLLAPRGHPLLKAKRLSLEMIARYPLVTTYEGLPGPRRVMHALTSAGLAAKIDVTVTNEDIVKACVEAGLGIAILASIVYDGKRDRALGARDVTPLLAPSLTHIVARRNALQLDYVAHFIRTFAPFWTADALARALHESR